jgi:3-hydroxybutyryl-CoA dehydrogenase
VSPELGVLVVGGGTMGRGIVGVCALSGYRTAVFEADPAARRGLRDAIAASWRTAVAKGKVSADAAEAAGNLVSVPESLEEARPAAIAIEAVPESLDLKRRIFEELDRLLPDAELLASNTSSLSIAALGEATRDPSRVVGLHFFNPVAAMPLVEVVRGEKSSAGTVERAARFAESLGKTPIRVADSPGFATSRLGLALGLEAIRMLEEGVASAADIDRAMELGYGHRMGPLKTSDLVGLDVRLAIADALAAALDDRRFAAPALLRRLVSEGRVGRKAGEGFYRWEGDRPLEKSGGEAGRE